MEMPIWFNRVPDPKQVAESEYGVVYHHIEDLIANAEWEEQHFGAVESEQEFNKLVLTSLDEIIEAAIYFKIEIMKEMSQPSEPEMEDGEVVVRLRDGWTLRSGTYGNSNIMSGEYVRLCDPAGREYLYWDQNEWRDDPALVMGAIINAAAGLRSSTANS